MTHFRTAATADRTPEGFAQRLGDVGILASLFVAPLWFGGRHDLGYVLYAIAVGVAAVGVFTHAALRGARPATHRFALALIVAAAGLLVVQATPLPAEIYDRLAPYSRQTLPLWTGGSGSLGDWRTPSVAPTETREGLALLACHALLLASIAARMRSKEDVRTVLRWIGYAGVAGAALALAQHAASNDKLLGVIEHPHVEMGDAVRGVYSNRNHFANSMALAVGPLLLGVIAAARSGSRRRPGGRRLAIGVALLSLVVVAGLASQSRGGAVALSSACGAALLLAWRYGAIGRSRAFAMVFVALAVISGVSLLGYDTITRRLDDIASGDVDTLDAQGARRAIWAANADALRASPIVGFGAGGHRDYYPLFLEEPFHREFTHAESGYLQIASETGAVGVALLLAGLALVAWWIVKGVVADRDPDRRLLWIGVAPGIAASCAHSAVDFVWYTPGLTAVLAALVACAMRLNALRGGESAPLRRREVATQGVGTYAFARVAVVTTVASLAIGTLAPPARGALAWDRYLRVSRALRGVSQQIANDPTRAGENLIETMAANTSHAIELLEGVVAVDPGNARAHLRLAGRYLQRYEHESSAAENGMSVDLVRGAAEGGGFADDAALQRWLDRAFGERAQLLRRAYAHARRAVRLAPFQGEGYVYLARLSFLDATCPSPNRLIEQALATRPYDGEVLFEAGRLRHIAGDAEEGLELWRRSAQRPGSHHQRLVALLAGSVPAADFLEALEPNHAVLSIALRRYREVGTEDDVAALADYAGRLASAAEAEGEEPPTALSARWALVSRTLRSVGDHGRAVEAARRAALLAPLRFAVRLELATALRQAERFDEADPHIRWCLARRPDIRYLHAWLAESAKRRTLVDRNRRGRHRLYAELAAKPKAAETETGASEPADQQPDRR